MCELVEFGKVDFIHFCFGVEVSHLHELGILHMWYSQRSKRKGEKKEKRR